MIGPVDSSDNHSTITAHHIIHTAQQPTNDSKQQLLDELDDPNELWRRPYSV